WYADLQVATTSSSDKANLVQTSREWIALKWNTRMCVGRKKGRVKLWSLSKETDPTCLTSFAVPSRRVDSIQFHPTADQILSTLGNDGKRICIWNIDKSDSPAYEIATPSATCFHSFSWKQDGVLLATSASSALGIWDPRATLGGGHDGIKGSRVIWLGETNYLFTAGQSKFRNREYGVWDARNLVSPVKKTSLDQSTGIMLPLYDQDTETMYLIGRGDATVRSLQFSDLVASPSVSENLACGTQATVYGAALMPKTRLNVMRAEVARVLAVVDHAIMPISFEVPRKQYLDFHADLFPDTKGNKPGVSGPDWLAGKNGQVDKVALDPAAAPKKNGVAASCSVTPADTPTVAVTTPASDSGSTLATKQLPTKSAAPTAVDSAAASSPSPADSAPKAVSENARTTEPALTEVKPKKQLPQYGSTHRNTYKYLSGKLYHVSTHYDDLRDLSVDKNGILELIQANVKFIAVPITGAGGRVGIIRVDQPGRLPTHIPSVLCGSPVTYFAFDPFDPHILATASEDDTIRLWKLPETGLEQDMSNDSAIGKLKEVSMEKISMIAFHPTARGVLMSVSNDLNKPAVRVWDVTSGEPKIRFETQSTVLSAAWSTDGTKVAVHGKDKKLRLFDARSGQIVGQVQPSHDGIVRPSRLVWLDETRLASVGFGAGSMREIILFTLDRRIAKHSIDISPSVMSVYYDPDCQVLYVAGRGDRIIHTYAVLDKGVEPLAKIEGLTLQQGFAFLPKRVCHVKETEIARFFRLTPTSVEPYGVRVPRARPEYFQDDIFIDTADTEHPAQDAKSWFEGCNKALDRISLKPDTMIALSQAPPPPQKEQSRAKFELGKKIVSDDERRQNLMDRMFSAAKHVDEDEEPEQKAATVPEVDEDEWVSLQQRKHFVF
ncbi:hypothetical protein BX666DRAFT_1869613, partial [Dichotomocladium elegans]